MRVIYSKPELKDLSQGSRITFIRQFRYMTQDEVSDKLTKKCTQIKHILFIMVMDKIC